MEKPNVEKPNVKVGDFVFNRKMAQRGVTSPLYCVQDVTERYAHILNPVTGKYEKEDLEIIVGSYNSDDHHSHSFNILRKDEDWVVIPKEKLVTL